MLQNFGEKTETSFGGAFIIIIIYSFWTIYNIKLIYIYELNVCMFIIIIHLIL